METTRKQLKVRHIAMTTVLALVFALFAAVQTVEAIAAAPGSDLVKPGVYLESCSKVDRNVGVICGGDVNNWVFGPSEALYCDAGVDPGVVLPLPANQVFNCEAKLSQCYTAGFPCGGCTAATSTNNAVCSGTGGCPTNGGIFTNVCSAMGCPAGKQLCGASNNCATIISCPAGTTFDACTEQCTSPYIINTPQAPFAPQAALIEITGDVTAAGFCFNGGLCLAEPIGDDNDIGFEGGQFAFGMNPTTEDSTPEYIIDIFSDGDINNNGDTAILRIVDAIDYSGGTPLWTGMVLARYDITTDLNDEKWFMGMDSSDSDSLLLRNIAGDNLVELGQDGTMVLGAQGFGVEGVYIDSANYSVMIGTHSNADLALMSGKAGVYSIGQGNEISNDDIMAIGMNNTLRGWLSTAIGNSNFTEVGANDNTLIGNGNRVFIGNGNHFFGSGLETEFGGEVDGAHLFGTMLTAGADASMTMGYGRRSGGQETINEVSSSLMIFNRAVKPALYVAPAIDMDTGGNVAINIDPVIETPLEQLHVGGKVFAEDYCYDDGAGGSICLGVGDGGGGEGAGSCLGSQFVGISGTAITGGQRSNYAGVAEYECGESGFPGAHICTPDEILRTLNCGGTLPTGVDGWVAGGAPGFTSPAVNDCSGWSSSAATSYGAFWSFEGADGGKGFATICSSAIKVACCK